MWWAIKIQIIKRKDYLILKIRFSRSRCLLTKKAWCVSFYQMFSNLSLISGQEQDHNRPSVQTLHGHSIHNQQDWGSSTKYSDKREAQTCRHSYFPAILSWHNRRSKEIQLRSCSTYHWPEEKGERCTTRSKEMNLILIYLNLVNSIIDWKLTCNKLHQRLPITRFMALIQSSILQVLRKLLGYLLKSDNCIRM